MTDKKKEKKVPPATAVEDSVPNNPQNDNEGANTTEDKLLKFLSKLDNTWTRLLVIGLIFMGGFRFGRYYEEAQQKNSLYDIKRDRDERYDRDIRNYSKTIDSLNNELAKMQIKMTNSQKEGGSNGTN